MSECIPCGNPFAKFNCATCKQAYCSRKCQVDDWNWIHKHLCARSFHVRVAKLFNLIAGGQYRCSNFSLREIRLIATDVMKPDYTVSMQTIHSGDRLCLVCGSGFYNSDSWEEINVTSIYRINRCANCAGRKSLCGVSFMPTNMCTLKRLYRCSIIIWMCNQLGLIKDVIYTICNQVYNHRCRTYEDFYKRRLPNFYGMH